ncbi:flavodoxin family protein [bacterium]|nr:flavodoxin family protein [bacterium]
MSIIAVIYCSRTGNTQKMAEEVARGAQGAGATVDLMQVDEANVEELTKYDAIIIGSPDYYAGMAAEIKEFLDASVVLHGKLAGKLGGAFSSSANVGGGNETTILSILQAFLVHGMAVMGEAIGDHFGPVSVNAPDDRVVHQCRTYGQSIARLADKLRG